MYIKRSFLLADLLDYQIKYSDQKELLEAFAALVRSQPAQEVQTIRTCHPTLKLGFQEYCSTCGKLTYLVDYCASCGAKVERRTHDQS